VLEARFVDQRFGVGRAEDVDEERPRADRVLDER
jgi:hypothetical protein